MASSSALGSSSAPSAVSARSVASAKSACARILNTSSSAFAACGRIFMTATTNVHAELLKRAGGRSRTRCNASANPGMPAEALQRVSDLPPARFSDSAWTFVVAVMKILPHAAKALEDVFRMRAQADFAEATLRALTALGADDEPSALLLAIDYRLSHLLIDEFQDTSSAQLALIGRLTEGWEASDGRTLFAVGDPMQSIYRFRQADVGLFLQAQARAHVAGVPVGVIELTRNFRSQREIVAWVN